MSTDKRKTSVENAQILSEMRDEILIMNGREFVGGQKEIVSRSPGVGLEEVSLIYGRPRGVTISIFELGILIGRSSLAPKTS